VESEDAAGRAAERARSAGRRTQELAARLVRLAAGQGSDADDLRQAQQHADEAVEHARESHERTVLGHERAARSHEHTAQVHDRAAGLGSGDPDAHRRLADEHRRSAAEDHLQAERERCSPLLPSGEDSGTDEHPA